MNQSDKKRKKNIHVKYIDVRLFNNKNNNKFHLDKTKKVVVLTISSIAVITSLVVAINHFVRETEIEQPIEYADSNLYTPLSIQIPITDYESIEDVANALYDERIYNNAFTDKDNYTNYLKSKNQNSTDYINATILVDKNDPNINNLNQLSEEIAETDKWLDYVAENGDSIWYFMEQGVIDGVRDVDQTRIELQQINNWSSHLPSLRVGDEVIIYNPYRIDLEKRYYETVRNTIKDYSVNEKENEENVTK